MKLSNFLKKGFKAYLILEEIRIGEKTIPEGSIALPYTEELVDELYSVETLRLNVRALELAYPKIAVYVKETTEPTLFKVLPEAGFDYQIIFDVDGLSKYDVLIFPPGTGIGLAKALGPQGCLAVKNMLKRAEDV